MNPNQDRNINQPPRQVVRATGRRPVNQVNILPPADVNRTAPTMEEELNQVRERRAQLLEQMREMQRELEREAAREEALRNRLAPVRAGRGVLEREFEEEAKQDRLVRANIMEEEKEMEADLIEIEMAPATPERIYEDRDPFYDRLEEDELLPRAFYEAVQVHHQEIGDMKTFLERVGVFLQSNLALQNLEDIRYVIQFLTGDDYAIFKFFAIAYRGYIANPQEETFVLGLSFNQWKTAFLNQVKQLAFQKRADFIRNSTQRGLDILINKMNTQQVLYALRRTVEVFLREQPEDRVADITLAVNSLLQNNRMGSAYNHPRYNLSLGEVNLIWDIFFAILRVMRALWSNNIVLPDLLLNQSLYRREVINGQEVSLLQAYPLLISKQRGNQYRPGGQELMALDTWNKIGWMVQNAGVEGFLIKVRIKKVFTKHEQNTQEPGLPEERWITLTMDPLTWRGVRPNERDLDMDEAAERRSRFDFRERDYFDYTLAVANSSLNAFTQWFFGILEDYVNRKSEKYAEYETLPDGTVDMDFVLIDYISVIGRQATNPSLPNRAGNSLRTAFCKSASGGWIGKMAFFSECCNLGICIFEALWTWRNKHKIMSKAKDEDWGFSYWKREEREKLLLKDFEKAPYDVKRMVLHGDIEKMRECFEEEIPFIYWEGDITPETKRRVRESDGVFIIFDSHVFFANPVHVIREIRKREEKLAKKKNYKENKHADGKEMKFEDQGRFKLRPRYTKKERREIKQHQAKEKAKKNQQPGQEQNEDVFVPEEWEEEEEIEDYFLDIETSINPQTHRFTPYLICVTGGDEPEKWWGNECVQEFLSWLKSKVDVRKGTEVGHNHKPTKVNIWTYNGMKFDLVFLVRHFVNFPEFSIQGSFDSIKGLTIGNVVFRDLLKICPFGSLAKQADFWKTNKKKTQVDHEAITDAWIKLVEDSPDDIDLMLERDKIIEYCVNDCEVLGECVVKYKTWVRENLDIDPHVISAAGLSYSYFLHHHYKAKGKLGKIKKDRMGKGLPKAVYPMVKTSYKGGIVMACRMQLKEGEVAETRDINSAYPFAMMHKVPIKCTGRRNFDVPYSLLDPTLRLNHHYLYQVVGMKWKDNMRIPTIPKRDDDGLNHTTYHSPVDWIWGVELEFAIKTGWLEQGEIMGEMLFHADYMFRDFVKELYENRRQKCKENGDTISDKFYKLLLNSLYGKFGQKIYPHKIVVNDRKLAYYADKIKGAPVEIVPGVWHIELIPEEEEDESEVNSDAGERLYGEEEEETIPQVDDDGVQLIKGQDTYYSSPGTMVHASSWITAFVRRYFMEAVSDVTCNFTLDTFIYGDTDAITYRKGSPFPEHKIHSSRLGAWDLEKANIVKFYGPCKKMYWMECEGPDGNIEIKKSKGITAHLMNKQDYIDLIEKGEVSNKNGGFKWVSRDGVVYKHENIKTLKNIPKRIYTLGGYSSMPLIY